MALILMEGFDVQANAAELFSNQITGQGLQSPNFVTGQNGNGRAAVLGYAYLAFQLPNPETHLVVQMRLQFQTANLFGGTPPMLIFNDTTQSIVSGVNTGNLCVQFDCTNSLVNVWQHVTQPLTPNNTTPSILLASQSFVIGSGNWFYVQTQVTLANSTGSVVVKINNNPVMNLTGVSTLNGYSTSCNQVVLNLPPNGGELYVDDLFIANTSGSVPNGLIGDQVIVTEYASANDVVGFTPNTAGAANYTMIDEFVSDGDVTFNYATGSGPQDTFVGDITVPSSYTISGVAAKVCVRQDAGAARPVATVLKSGSSTQSGNVYYPSTTYTYQNDAYGINPFTSAAWTYSDVNNLKFGYKAV